MQYDFLIFAEVMELADVLDSKSSGETRAGSSPAFGTKIKQGFQRLAGVLCFVFM
jgi:hypothetical protein